MKRILTVFFLASLLSVIPCGDVWAQATAQISGTARDQSGAVLPGVEVTATQTETGIARTAVTNETGSYSLPNLAVGPYRYYTATDPDIWARNVAGHLGVSVETRLDDEHLFDSAEIRFSAQSPLETSGLHNTQTATFRTP